MAAEVEIVIYRTLGRCTWLLRKRAKEQNCSVVNGQRFLGIMPRRAAGNSRLRWHFAKLSFAYFSFFLKACVDGVRMPLREMVWWICLSSFFFGFDEIDWKSMKMEVYQEKQMGENIRELSEIYVSSEKMRFIYQATGK